jgi:hypothetical protein
MGSKTDVGDRRKADTGALPRKPGLRSSALGGVGVVMSVVYVSIQIRHNTLAVRSSAFQQVVNSFAAITFDIVRDRTLAPRTI